MRIRRPFRAVGYLAIIVAAVGYVVWSSSRLPAFINGTFVGTLTADVFGKVRSTGRQNALFYLRKEGNAWQSLDSSHVLGTDFAVCAISSAPYRSGFWHATFEERGVRVDFRDASGNVSLDSTDRREMLLAIEAAHSGTVTPELLSAYVSGGTLTRRILWLGILGDLSILAAFAAIIFSLVKLRREIRWHKPGHCAKCEYDLAGLTVDKCPECGAAVMPATSPKSI